MKVEKKTCFSKKRGGGSPVTSTAARDQLQHWRLVADEMAPLYSASRSIAERRKTDGRRKEISVYAFESQIGWRWIRLEIRELSSVVGARHDSNQMRLSKGGMRSCRAPHAHARTHWKSLVKKSYTTTGDSLEYSTDFHSVFFFFFFLFAQAWIFIHVGCQRVIASRRQIGYAFGIESEKKSFQCENAM